MQKLIKIEKLVIWEFISHFSNTIVIDPSIGY